VKLRIGTRRSSLALAQAREIADRLASTGVESELVPMLTSGDRGLSGGAVVAGLKGLFVVEIVRALQEGRVDLAVHSAKDLPASDEEAVTVAAVPPRADPGDLLITREGALPTGATVGTSSLRRQAQLLAWRPDLRPRDLRGNVDTRLRKLDEQEVDAVVLAAAGLARLGVSREHAEALPIIPAPGQGCLALQARADDWETLEAVAPIDHQDSHAAFDAERSLVAHIGGGCALPLGALATVEPGAIRMIAVVATADGSRVVRAEVEAATPEGTAERAATELLTQGAAEILAQARP
jgi:hydroxymethylbilane synthase